MAGVVALLVFASGCAPRIEDTSPSPADRDACERLVAALPSRVDDQKKRRTTGNELGAAWGDPAITLRCGVGRPKGYDPIAQCQVVDGLGWFVPEKGMNDQSVDVVLTAISRKPIVEVTLPAEYRPPVAAMVDLAETIRAHTEPNGFCD